MVGLLNTDRIPEVAAGEEIIGEEARRLFLVDLFAVDK